MSANSPGTGAHRRQEARPDPRGGGHRAHGRAIARRGRGLGYDYVHSAVDDRSRVAFSQILPDEKAATAARFLVQAAGFFAEHRVRIERVLTDNAKAYADSVLFAETAAGLGIRRKRTRRYRPQTNGKVERFHKTLLDEWAYARLYHSNAERCRALAGWLRSDNHRRPHTSLDGLTPMAILVNNAHGKHTERGRGVAWGRHRMPAPRRTLPGGVLRCPGSCYPSRPLRVPSGWPSGRP